MTPNEKLKDAFVRALGMPPDADFEKATYGETEGWDSAAHMALIAEIETAYDIMLDTEEVIGMSSFPKAREIVTNHGVSFAA
ncbi:MAG TPA: acyl carrier protein [Bryobacteraceae bacterium]|jgi:acyl carrier protein|nr:acyl carrier protein [Bryobacteraceae bacterium]